MKKGMKTLLGLSLIAATLPEALNEVSMPVQKRQRQKRVLSKKQKKVRSASKNAKKARKNNR